MTELIHSKSIQDYCRVCFESPPELVSCLSTMIFENFSFSIRDMLNQISPEVKVSCIPFHIIFYRVKIFIVI